MKLRERALEGGLAEPMGYVVVVEGLGYWLQMPV
jgi:hypothetical protein